MQNHKPRHSSSSASRMVSRHLPAECQEPREINSASGSRSDRERDREMDSDNDNNVIDNINDNSNENSIRSSKSRPLARLDRLLRRWLPGYNYLRGGTAASGVGGSGASGGSQPPETDAAMPPLARERQTSHNVDTPLPARMRRNGEVLLDTGIAKSEFCLKLEQLLRAKLIVKD